jgi:HD-GYP domain-containing protein (c-di-GMP phosphodiesterase class II)
MEKLSLKELAVPMIKAIDSFNYLLKSHHRRTAVISYHIGKELGLKDDYLLELVIAASLHDIGALSVQERDMLIQEDVTNPQPHCMMGYQMLKTFDVFRDIAKIIKHHHIIYKDSLNMKEGEVLFASYIIHLADRVDVLLSPDEFILTQKKSVTEKIKEKVAEVFHPEVFEAFLKASKSDIFWIDINNMSMHQLFNKIDFSLDFELTIDQTVEFALTISRIIDFRSKFTASHSYTVAHLAEQIGKYFRFDDEKCKKLLIAGYIHDIGKIGIDPGLLEKDGPLTDDEFRMMKLHAYYTGQILSELNVSEWFREIVIWTENHHEKNDGTGYPHGLHEDDLDKGGKILAFADVITALLEDRPYRKGMELEKAFSILREEIAPKISSKMFEVIEEYKEEISQIVNECQEFSRNKYQHDKSAI